MQEFVRVFDEGGGYRNVPVAQGTNEIVGNRGVKNILNVGIPFVTLPGTGAAGLRFSGTTGAFTLSAAINANIWNLLTGFYAYFPANFGGSTLPAGWYWCTMSSDTAGIVYANTYSSGQPTRPATPTAFPAATFTDLAWLTQIITEITAISGFTLPGGALGPNGCLTNLFKVLGSTGGNKSYRAKIGGTTTAQVFPTTAPSGEFLNIWRNQGNTASQANSRGSTVVGIGVTSASVIATERTTVDTAVDNAITITLQCSSNADSMVLLYTTMTATYGD